jgi:hypothetical protein
MNSQSENSVADRSSATAAASIKSGAYALSFNGGAILTGTGTVPPTTRLFVGSVVGQYFNGVMRGVAIYPRPFGNTELQAAKIGPVSFANDNSAPEEMQAALWGWVA